MTILQATEKLERFVRRRSTVGQKLLASLLGRRAFRRALIVTMAHFPPHLALASDSEFHLAVIRIKVKYVALYGCGLCAKLLLSVIKTIVRHLADWRHELSEEDQLGFIQLRDVYDAYYDWAMMIRHELVVPRRLEFFFRARLSSKTLSDCTEWLQKATDRRPHN